MRDLTVGIIAYGAISREIARLAQAFGAKVIVCTRAGKPQAHTGFRVEGTGDVDGSIPTKYYTMEKESVREFLGE
jgi:phosphoglycerate dehydrogenase-like enzyme